MERRVHLRATKFELCISLSERAGHTRLSYAGGRVVVWFGNGRVVSGWWRVRGRVTW